MYKYIRNPVIKGIYVTYDPLLSTPSEHRSLLNHDDNNNALNFDIWKHVAFTKEFLFHKLCMISCKDGKDFLNDIEMSYIVESKI